MHRLLYLLLAALLTSATVSADSIRVGNVVYRDVYIRESEDFFFVYHPELGSIERVSRRRSNVSDVVISGDIAYRQGLLARYNAKKAALAPKPVSRTVVRTLDGDLVKFRQHVKDLAVFESQLAHWKTLPAEVRERIQGGLYESLAQRTARRAADRERALVQLDELGGTRVAVEEQLALAAQERAAAVEQARAEDSSDFYMDAYEKSRGYVLYHHFYIDECANLRSIPTWWFTEDPSLYDAALEERARTRERINAADQAFADQASVYGSKLNSVERAMTQQERAARAAVAKSIDEQRRFGSQQVRAAALTEATEAGYHPQLRIAPIATWSGVSAQRLPEFTVGEGLWRLDCHLREGMAADRFAVTVYDAATGKPFTRIAGPDFLGMRTRVFDEPGTYYVAVEVGPVAVPYEINVSAMELP